MLVDDMIWYGYSISTIKYGQFINIQYASHSASPAVLSALAQGLVMILWPMMGKIPAKGIHGGYHYPAWTIKSSFKPLPSLLYFPEIYL